MLPAAEAGGQGKMMREHFKVIFVLCLMVPLTGCGSGSFQGSRTEIPETPSDLSSYRTSGTVLLDVAGAGYRIGDIVRIRSDTQELSMGDAVLFDWRKALDNPPAFGPTYLIGEVIGVPGGLFNMPDLLHYVGRDGKEKPPWFSTFESRGISEDESTILLQRGDYLIETNSHVIIVDRASVTAVVVERIGHDDEAEQSLKQRVY